MMKTGLLMNVYLLLTNKINRSLNIIDFTKHESKL